MTNEEAIKSLNTLRESINGVFDYNCRNQCTALDMAIKALEQQPCEDCISREEVLEGLANIAKVKAKSDAQKSMMGRCMFFVEQLPPVTPRTNLAEASQDCISKEEVRKVLSNEVFELMKLHTVNPEDNPKADAMAHGVNWSLNTLMELPPVTPQIEPCEDCISRQAVLDYAKDTCVDLDKDEDTEIFCDEIKAMSPVTPERPKGKWIEVDVHNFYATLKCSVCDRVIEPYFSFGEYSYEDIKTFYPYCHCGAEMSGGGEG